MIDYGNHLLNFDQACDEFDTRPKDAHIQD